MICLCLCEDFFIGEQRVFRYTGVIVCGLGTEFTIFGAAAAFSVDDGTEVKTGRTKMSADFVRIFTQLVQRLVI